MISPRRLGLAIMVAGPILAVIYAISVIFFWAFVLEVTALTFMLILLGLVSWIGYTMFTEPKSSRPTSSDVELDDLSPETINPTPSENSRIARNGFSVVIDCSVGEGTIIRDQVNLFKCKIGRDCKIESFVYVEEGVTIGDRCKIKPNVFIPTGVQIGSDVFVGPNATFTNDKYPKANGDWKLLETRVGSRASIGGHAVILPGVKIGERAVVGAGAVVTRDVAAGSVVVGNPAREIGSIIRENIVI